MIALRTAFEFVRRTSNRKVLTARRRTTRQATKPMSKTFKRGDHVEWNSEAGRVRGVIVKKVSSNTRFKGYVHHASKGEPQYLIKSDVSDHIAIHKGAALKRLKPKTKRQSKARTKRKL